MHVKEGHNLTVVSIEQGPTITDQDSSRDESSDDGRFTQRYKSHATAVIVRETDQMRTGIPATLHNVSVGGVGFSIETELEIDEQIKIRLVNQIQRFEKEVRGKVRRVSPTKEGTFFCGVELYTRLTPLDITLVRTNIVAHPDNDGPLWI